MTGLRSEEIPRQGDCLPYWKEPPVRDISGLRALSALVLIRDKILVPLLASATQFHFTSGPTSATELDNHYEALRKEMWATLVQLGIAA